MARKVKVNGDKRIGLLPGAFDPVTSGHVDLIKRAAGLFDELIVAVGDNPGKSAVLSAARRAELIRLAIGDTCGVRVEAYTRLTIDFARKLNATAIVRGIRNGADLNSELQMAYTNRAAAGVETVFVLADPRCAFISSGLVKQMLIMGGDVSSLVPPAVLARVKAAYRNSRR